MSIKDEYSCTPILSNSPPNWKLSKQESKPKQSEKQLKLFPQPVATLPIYQESQATPYLQIASAPLAERVNQKENRYILLIQPQGIRACGGQYTADEIHEIAQLTKGWDWELDKNSRPHCLPRLETLLDAIINRVNRGVDA